MVCQPLLITLSLDVHLIKHRFGVMEATVCE